MRHIVRGSYRRLVNFDGLVTSRSVFLDDPYPSGDCSLFVVCGRVRSGKSGLLRRLALSERRSDRLIAYDPRRDLVGIGATHVLTPRRAMTMTDFMRGVLDVDRFLEAFHGRVDVVYLNDVYHPLELKFAINLVNAGIRVVLSMHGRKFALRYRIQNLVGPDVYVPPFRVVECLVDVNGVRLVRDRGIDVNPRLLRN